MTPQLSPVAPNVRNDRQHAHGETEHVETGTRRFIYTESQSVGSRSRSPPAYRPPGPPPGVVRGDIGGPLGIIFLRLNSNPEASRLYGCTLQCMNNKTSGTERGLRLHLCKIRHRQKLVHFRPHRSCTETRTACNPRQPHANQTTSGSTTASRDCLALLSRSTHRSLRPVPVFADNFPDFKEVPFSELVGLE